MPNNDPKPLFSHKEYVIARAERLHGLFTSMGTQNELMQRFREDPATVAAEHGIRLTDEEAFAIKSLETFEPADIYERLTIGSVAFFDANCGCAMPELT
ncbi:hypothetical protein ACFQZ4_49510 [Catellatospora coxensis]